MSSAASNQCLITTSVLTAKRFVEPNLNYMCFIFNEECFKKLLAQIVCEKTQVANIKIINLMIPRIMIGPQWEINCLDKNNHIYAVNHIDTTILK